MFPTVRERLKKIMVKFMKVPKNFQKMIKLLLDKQIFASSDARFCSSTRNDGRNTQNFGHDTRNIILDMVLSP